jgi:hypothetical protein
MKKKAECYVRNIRWAVLADRQEDLVLTQQKERKTFKSAGDFPATGFSKPVKGGKKLTADLST